MSLLSYRAARPWARAIKAKVVAREMPPWFLSDNPQHPVTDINVLTQAQIDILAAWADGGAPEGTEPAPEPPKFVDNVNAAIGRAPEYTLSTATIDIPASGQFQNINVWTKTPFTANTFFEATEMRPTNRAVTHHAGTFALAVPAGSSIGRGPAWKGGPEIDGILTKPDGTVDDAAGAEAAEFATSQSRRCTSTKVRAAPGATRTTASSATMRRPAASSSTRRTWSSGWGRRTSISTGCCTTP